MSILKVEGAYANFDALLRYMFTRPVRCQQFHDVDLNVSLRPQQPVDGATVNYLSKQLDDLEGLDDGDLLAWKDELEHGNAAASFSMLLLLVAHVEILRLSAGRWDRYFLSSAAELHGFRRLRKIEIDVRQMSYSALAFVFKSTPVRKVKIHGLTEPERVEEWEHAFANVHSQVDSLRIPFPETVLSLRTLQALLKCCVALRVFEFDTPNQTSPTAVSRFDCTHVIDMLMPFQHSLEKLSICAYNSSMSASPFRALAKFSQLRKTLCSAGAALDPSSSDTGFYHFLAPCQEKIYLYHANEALLSQLIGDDGPFRRLLHARQNGIEWMSSLKEIWVCTESGTPLSRPARQRIHILFEELRDWGLYLKIVAYDFCSDPNDLGPTNDCVVSNEGDQYRLDETDTTNSSQSNSGSKSPTTSPCTSVAPKTQRAVTAASSTISKNRMAHSSNADSLKKMIGKRRLPLSCIPDEQPPQKLARCRIEERGKKHTVEERGA